MSRIKETIYNIARNSAKKILTNNLGKVVEDEEKLICYVDKRKVKKEKYSYKIACFGISGTTKELAEAFNLNKPICYIIDGINLKRHQAYIFGYNNCEIIIKNCNFGLNLILRNSGKCTLDNINITTGIGFLSLSANELVIKNMEKEQIEIFGSNHNIGFDADDKLNIIDCNLGNEKYNISLNATNELNIINSNITGNNVSCEAKKINVDEKSTLLAADKVDLKADDFNPINIIASSIVYKGEEVKTERKPVLFKKIKDSLTLRRIELIEILKRLRSKCEDINSSKALNYKESLNNQSLVRTLK